jgi:hypothetical protein
VRVRYSAERGAIAQVERMAETGRPRHALTGIKN